MRTSGQSTALRRTSRSRYTPSVPKTTILAVQQLENGELIFVDANGRQHPAKGAAAAWVVLKQILADDSLPRVEQPHLGEVQFEDVVTEFVQSQMPPGLGRLAKPAVNGLLQGLRNLSRRNHSR